MTNLSNRQRRIAKKRTPSPPKVKAAGAIITMPQPKHRKPGLEWMLAKKQINLEQFHTGMGYGADYRTAAVHGVEGLRSCLSDSTGGGGRGGVALTFAEIDQQAAERLHNARQTLGFHTDMTAACDAICGKGFTPREINPDQRAAATIAQTLRIALDLMSQHYPLTNYLKRA